MAIGISAIGINDKVEIAKIAKQVPTNIKSEFCNICLWSCVECKSGSLYNSENAKTCLAYSYYD
jgi:hypothetical protein